MGPDSIVMSASQRALATGDSAFANQVAQASSRYAAGLLRLRALRDKERYREAARLQRRIIGSFSSHLTCAVRSIGVRQRNLVNAVYETVLGFDAFACKQEAVAFKTIKKPGGRDRIVCIFGPRRALLDRLCADLLNTQLGVAHWNMLVRGRGADVANAFLSKKIKARTEWFVTADIESFYPSVRPEKLLGVFPLPESLLESCITPTTLHYTPATILQERLNGAARSGITLGSRSASVVASWLIGPMLEDYFPVGQFIVYADDLLICAGSYDEAVLIEKALHELFAAHPFGPFRLKSHIHSAREGVDFLKYKTRLTYDGEIWSRPTSKSIARHLEEIHRIALTTSGEAEAWEECENYIKAWTSAFTAWAPNDASEACLVGSRLEAFDRGRAERHS